MNLRPVQMQRIWAVTCRARTEKKSVDRFVKHSTINHVHLPPMPEAFTHTTFDILQHKILTWRSVTKFKRFSAM